MSVKFRNPKTGEVFEVTDCCNDMFCKHITCCSCNCPIYTHKGASQCADYVNEHPYEAAKLMGYEVVEDSNEVEIETGKKDSQSLKADAGKPRPSLVPPALVRGVDAIREYGCTKYHDPENWRKVEPQRYWDALLRHTLAAWEDWTAVDDESGMPHLWHIACNAAFLMSFMEDESMVNQSG